MMFIGPVNYFIGLFKVLLALSQMKDINNAYYIIQLVLKATLINGV